MLLLQIPSEVDGIHLNISGKITPSCNVGPICYLSKPSR